MQTTQKQKSPKNSQPSKKNGTPNFKEYLNIYIFTPKCTTTMGLNTRKLWVARHQNHNQHHQQTSNDQPTHKQKIGKYIIASPVDLTLALQYVQDGGLEKTRLQQIYDKYGLTSWFIRDDVVAMFHDSYSSTQASLNVHRSILRPVIGDIDDPDAPYYLRIQYYVPTNTIQPKTIE